VALDYKIFDGWINMVPEKFAYGSFDVSYLFSEVGERVEQGRTTEEIVEEMDRAGMDQAVLAAGYDFQPDDVPWALDALKRFPDRFHGSFVVDPRKGMEGVRELESRVRDDGFVMARISAYHTMVPYTDPRCYPLYAKCVELDIPISINVGVPGPLVPAAQMQDPIHLDEICAFFPELKIIMAHCGDPWADLCVKLMLKWKNLYMMTSAFSPKRYPEALVHYMNSRGADKVMFASDYPLVGLERCAREVAEMDFRDEERRRKFLSDNARRVILGQG